MRSLLSWGISSKKVYSVCFCFFMHVHVQRFKMAHKVITKFDLPTNELCCRTNVHQQWNQRHNLPLFCVLKKTVSAHQHSQWKKAKREVSKSNHEKETNRIQFIQAMPTQGIQTYSMINVFYRSVCSLNLLLWLCMHTYICVYTYTYRCACVFI